MSGDVTLVWGEEFMRYKLSEDHPLQPIRVKLTVELIRELGLVEFAHVVPPRLASTEEIALSHDPGYIELVEELSEPALREGVDPGRAFRHGLGTGDPRRAGAPPGEGPARHPPPPPSHGGGAVAGGVGGGGPAAPACVPAHR